jgi:hypothetical protein
VVGCMQSIPNVRKGVVMSARFLEREFANSGATEPSQSPSERPMISFMISLVPA